MAVYKTITTDVDVEVDLDEWDDDELIEELESRGFNVGEHSDPETSKDLLEKIWQLRRTNQPYDHLMDPLIYNLLGKLI